MSQKHYQVKAVAAWAICVAFLLVTDPYKLPAIFLLLPFIIIFMATYYTVMSVFLRKPKAHKNPKRFAYVISTVVAVLLAMQSLGQLTLRDLVVVLALVVLGCFYIARTGDSK